MLSRAAACILITALAMLNAYLDILHVRETRRAAITRPPPPEHYTFVDEDYTPRMPLPSARRAVKLTIEDSIRYGLWEAQAEDEWRWTATFGDGNVHLGPNSRFFVVGITHQLHCMRAYREALAQDEPLSQHQVGHLGHCLNFFRMSTLCAADTTLEPGDVLSRNHTQDRLGGEHVCLDWPGFYDEMKANYLEWSAFQQSLGQQ